MDDSGVEIYQWNADIGDYLLAVRVKQENGCRLLRSVKRRKRKLGEPLPECPALTGELPDCQGCQWQAKEK